MIPVIQHEVLARQWMSGVRFAETVALAGMAPGPIAANSAIYIGYQMKGIAGSISAAAGIVLPSIIVIVLISMFFYKVYEHKMVKSSFYGLKPMIAALILVAAIQLAIANPMVQEMSGETLVTGFIFIAAFLGITFYRIHPMAIILLSGLAGIAFFG